MSKLSTAPIVPYTIPPLDTMRPNTCSTSNNSSNLYKQTPPIKSKSISCFLHNSWFQVMFLRETTSIGIERPMSCNIFLLWELLKFMSIACLSSLKSILDNGPILTLLLIKSYKCTLSSEKEMIFINMKLFKSLD